MKLSREWITPLTIGSFGLLATTGMLMFLHLDRGLNKLAHEWLSWLLVAAVVGHATVNFAPLKRHFAATRGRAIVALCAAVLAASFVPLGAKGKPNSSAPLA